jgi:hypothetical protein
VCSRTRDTGRERDDDDHRNRDAGRDAGDHPPIGARDSNANAKDHLPWPASDRIDARRLGGSGRSGRARGLAVRVGVRRRLQRVMDRRRALAPEVLRARWRGLGIERNGARAERHEILARTQPVAGKANDLCLRLRLCLSYLGSPTFPHPGSALFQRFLRRRRECRPLAALLYPLIWFQLDSISKVG